MGFFVYFLRLRVVAMALEDNVSVGQTLVSWMQR